MSFSTEKQKIKTVGDLKKYLAPLPDGAAIVTPSVLSSTGWDNPSIYFDASYSDDWGRGDEVRTKHYNKHDIWISAVCIESTDDDD